MIEFRWLSFADHWCTYNAQGDCCILVSGEHWEYSHSLRDLFYREDHVYGSNAEG